MITKFYISDLPDRENIPTMFSTFDILPEGVLDHKQIVMYADTDSFSDQLCITLKRNFTRHCKVSSLMTPHNRRDYHKPSSSAPTKKISSVNAETVYCIATTEEELILWGSLGLGVEIFNFETPKAFK
uniref:Uncharacterized protein n=1 Tax=Ditylenchus dipsaci TaxID=166011 RepID=A0A915DNC5_9BILA